MSLTEYNRKRRFERTPEPKGAKNRSRSGKLFVVQKHDASRLHYDFRLELDGTLKSWAIPKGPSLEPKERRLAVHVEDHPVEYGGFEGIIPEGEYGGGTVILWDRGTWEPLGDAEKDYREGKLKFYLKGKKLRGGWMLVRMPPREGDSGDNWLLIKERDEFARPSDDFDVTVAEPNSVKSGKSIAEVAAKPGRVWSSRKSRSAGEPDENDQSPQARIRRTAQVRLNSAKSPVVKAAQKKSAKAGKSNTSTARKVAEASLAGSPKKSRGATARKSASKKNG